MQKDSIDVMFLGASHASYGVNSMQLYEDTHITSYNLSTSGQPIEMTYFLMKKMFQTQAPELIIVDCSGLFHAGEADDPSVRKVMDSLPYCTTKLDIAKWYASLHPEESGRLLGALLPLRNYHDRWCDLQKNDFSFESSGMFYNMGWYMTSKVASGGETVEQIESIVKELSPTDAAEIDYSSAVTNERNETNVRYAPEISQKNEYWLREIQKLCKDNHSKLVLISIPAMVNPVRHGSAWTWRKHEIAAVCADKLGIPFVDLLYDVELGLDGDTDFSDGGMHVNVRGAKKVTKALESIVLQYLPDNYVGAEEQYESCLPTYRKMLAAAELESERSLESYLGQLNTVKDNSVVVFAASDDMRRCLSDAEMRALGALGLRCDFMNEMQLQDSYIAVIDCGEIELESRSNRALEKAYYADDFTIITIKSAGWRNGAIGSVQINGAECSYNRRGINIVVIDKETGCLIDSVCFDTYLENHLAYRETSKTEHILREYEMIFL